MKTIEDLVKNVLNKERLKRSFSVKACVYDRNARLQKQTAQDLLKTLNRFKTESKKNSNITKILDIGIGTGSMIPGLSDIYKDASIIGFDLAEGMVKFARQQQYKVYLIQADAEELPFKKETFDLAVSNLTYQWVSDLQNAFNQVNLILVPDGVFQFTTLGAGTLSELHTSYLNAHQKTGIPAYAHGQDFVTKEEIMTALQKAGFLKINIKVRQEKQTYADVKELGGSLKNIGAANALKSPNKGLGGKKLFEAMADYYQQHYSCPEGIYANFEIFTITALK